MSVCSLKEHPCITQNSYKGQNSMATFLHSPIIEFTLKIKSLQNQCFPHKTIKWPTSLNFLKQGLLTFVMLKG